MGNAYGIPTPAAHVEKDLRPPARYLVLIDSGGSAQALLFLESREQVAEFDAMAEEVSLMTQGLEPRHEAHLPIWDAALGGHSAQERAAARVYTLDV